MSGSDEPRADFRGDRMPTAEGHGNARGRARQAWDAYARTVNRVADPVVRPLAQEHAASTVTDLVGFWLLWQLEGGFEGLLNLGLSRASIYRRVSAFRKSFGVHPDDYEFPGVTVDVAAYLRGLERPEAPNTPKSQSRDK